MQVTHMPILPHILPCLISQYCLYYFGQACFHYYPWNSMCVWLQYLPEHLRNARHCSYCDFLHGSSFDLLIHSGQRSFYLLIATQPAFLFHCEPVSFPKPEKSWPVKGRLLSDLTSKGHSYWLDSSDKVSSRRPEVEIWKVQQPLQKVRKKISDFLFSLQYQYKMLQIEKYQPQILTHHVFAQQCF